MHKQRTHLRLLSLLLFMSIGGSSWGGNINTHTAGEQQHSSNLTTQTTQQQSDIFDALYWINNAAEEGEPKANHFLNQAKKYGWLGLKET